MNVADQRFMKLVIICTLLQNDKKVLLLHLCMNVQYNDTTSLSRYVTVTFKYFALNLSGQYSSHFSNFIICSYI